jgi:hypothetical protein
MSPILYIFLIKILNNFPEFSFIQSVPNKTVSSCRLFSMAHEFHMAAWYSLMALGCRAKFTYFFCSAVTAISHSPLLCLCLFSINIVASSITQLLMVVSNVYVWKVFFSPHVLTAWQSSIEGWVCAWSSNSALLPTQIVTGTSCFHKY